MNAQFQLFPIRMTAGKDRKEAESDRRGLLEEVAFELRPKAGGAAFLTQGSACAEAPRSEIAPA